MRHAQDNSQFVAKFQEEQEQGHRIGTARHTHAHALSSTQQFLRGQYWQYASGKSRCAHGGWPQAAISFASLKLALVSWKSSGEARSKEREVYAWRTAGVLAKLGRNWIARPLLVPNHGENPPAIAVEVELKDIYAALDPFAGSRRAFIAAQHRRHIAVAVNHMIQFALREAFPHRRSVRTVRKFLLRHRGGRDCGCFRIDTNRHRPRVRIEQGAVASPLPRHAHAA